MGITFIAIGLELFLGFWIIQAFREKMFSPETLPNLIEVRNNRKSVYYKKRPLEIEHYVDKINSAIGIVFIGIPFLAPIIIIYRIQHTSSSNNTGSGPVIIVILVSIGLLILISQQLPSFYDATLQKRVNVVNGHLLPIERAYDENVAPLSEEFSSVFMFNEHLISLQQYLESHVAEIFVEPTLLEHHIQPILSQIRSDAVKLNKAKHLKEQAEQLYEHIKSNNPTSGKFSEMSEYIDYLHALLTSSTLTSVLMEKRWDDFYDITEFIVIRFQGLLQQTANHGSSIQEPKTLHSLSEQFASEFEQSGQYKSAVRMYLKKYNLKKIIHIYQTVGAEYEQQQKFNMAREMYNTALYWCQKHCESFNEKQLLAYAQQHPESMIIHLNCASTYRLQQKWSQAVTYLQPILDNGASTILKGKALFIRAQCFLGRAEGADIILGLQDMERALTDYRDALSLDDLTGMVTQLKDTQYLQVTGTQMRFPQEYDRILSLLFSAIEQHYANLFMTDQISIDTLFEQSEQMRRHTPELAGTVLKSLVTGYQQQSTSEILDNQKAFRLAVRLWQHDEQALAEELLDTIGNRYQQQLERSQESVPQVMELANQYWAKAQELPDIPLYDRMAERLWRAIAAALESKLPLEQLSKTNLESYYWLLKAYQAVREPVKCAEIGVKILGVVGFQGYKDVRAIVDNIVTGGFQRQHWQTTGEGSLSQQPLVSQPTASEPKQTEQFGTYSGTYFTSGGMGDIYKGVAPTGEAVAIKRIPRYALYGNRLERFTREIQMVRQLSHPHIVKVLEVNQDEGWYVMEWAENGTLEERLKDRQTLAVTDALDIAWQIADALAAVHEHGIIHRDIKPSNILLFADRTAKLTDFGVAHAERAETLTGTGVQVGTLRYMSPEQYLAEEIDAKTDVFALGLVLYEMLTGDIPFANPRKLCQQDIEDVFANQHPATLPEEMLPILIKCLRNNANRRYSSRELKAALQKMRTTL